MGIFSRNLLNTPKVPHFSPQILIHFSNMNQEKLKQLQAQVRIGGKGTARRKKKFVHRTATTDDKKLQSSLKKLSVNNIPGIEEVNMIKDDGTVIHFNNPKVQASLAANTFAVTGHGENKQITDLLPGILNQLGAESLTHLKKLASNVPSGMDGTDGALGLETMPTMTMMCLISWRTLTHAAKPNPSAQVRKRPTAWKQTRKTQRSKWCGSPQTFSHTLQKSKYFTVSKKRRRNQDLPKSS